MKHDTWKTYIKERDPQRTYNTKTVSGLLSKFNDCCREVGEAVQIC